MAAAVPQGPGGAAGVRLRLSCLFPVAAIRSVLDEKHNWPLRRLVPSKDRNEMTAKIKSPNKRCKRCGQMFGRRENEDHYRFAARSYCSRACSDPGRGELTMANARERFMSFVSPEPNSGCWLWLGALARGYGAFSFGKLMRAPRFSYEEFKGEIPAGHVVRHTCDNKLCVNPDHLITGTRSDNAQDALSRGLAVVGSRSPAAKITENDALAIIEDTRPLAEIAATYGLSKSRVCTIKKGRGWKHVGRPEGRKVG